MEPEAITLFDAAPVPNPHIDQSSGVGSHTRALDIESAVPGSERGAPMPSQAVTPGRRRVKLGLDVLLLRHGTFELNLFRAAVTSPFSPCRPARRQSQRACPAVGSKMVCK